MEFIFTINKFRDSNDYNDIIITTENIIKLNLFQRIIKNYKWIILSIEIQLKN